MAVHGSVRRQRVALNSDMDKHLTQRLVELGHLGMIPACCLGLVAEEGQKETDWSDAETFSGSLGLLWLLFPYTHDSNRCSKTVSGVVYKRSYQIQVIFRTHEQSWHVKKGNAILTSTCKNHQLNTQIVSHRHSDDRCAVPLWCKMSHN